MGRIPRVVVTVLAFIAVVAFCNLFISMVFSSMVVAVLSLLSWVVAFLVARFVWQSLTEPDNGFVSSVFLWACVLGGIGFAAGFFGPLILAPDANQGPLLGIFITGPLGFLLGGIVGAIRWAWRRQP